MTPMSSSPSVDRAVRAPADGRWTPRLVLLLVALAWPTQLLAAGGILGANAIPGVAQAFHTTQVAWFGLTLTLVSMLLTPFVIKLGDLYGKKRVMLAMTALGALGEALAALAGSFWLVLAGRAVAGCYGPFGALSFAAVRDVFPSRLVKPASGIMGSSVGLVALFSPFLAGWLVDHWGYRGVLWFLAAATAVACALIAFLVPETPRHAADSGFDWLGGLVLGGGLTAVVYAVGQAQSWGWTDTRTLGWLLAGVIALIAFFFVERASDHPILDLSVLRRRPVALALTAGGLAQTVAFTMPGLAIVLALYPHIPGVSAGLGWTAHHNAVVSVSWNLVMFGTGLLISRALRHLDVRRIWWAGLAVMAVGYALVGVYHGTELQLIVTSCIANVGAGIVVAGAPALVVGVVSRDEQGLGSGMLNMLISLFGALVTAGAYAILAADSTVVDGTAFYLDTGYTWIFWLGSLVTVAALLLSLFIPRLREPEGESPDGAEGGRPVEPQVP
ncbi:MFS transporter [Streptomyces justiciae]|uniref:MFS transporter n=1 Tax=Streptomyces justiciae TaxID=2780140 RepID=UPI002118F815|nr:MFS transporter [Streptomyces justiciae]MCW8383567.1 MFS transporter [Streptomyces justiciae]